MKRLALAITALLALGAAITAQGIVRVIRPGEVARPGQPQPGEPALPAGPAVEPVDPTPEEAARISDLIEQLGSPRMAARDRAMAEIAAFAEKALRQVRQARGNPDDEISNRCEILDEVISSRQGELFLAARHLNIAPRELERLLGASEPKPLLDLLKARAQPGMTPVWARVLARLATRPQLITAAQLCAASEGDEGYGLALAAAARQSGTARLPAPGLVSLAALLPPRRAADAVNTLAWCAAGTGDVHAALLAARALRGAYPAAQALAALEAPEQMPADVQKTRQALALCFAPACPGAVLDAAPLPPLAGMDTLALQEYFALLQRGAHAARVQDTLVALVAADAPPRALAIAGAAWADATPLEKWPSDFGALPNAARIGALDALWLSPREPGRARDFLVALLRGPDATLRAQAARMLGQYRSPGTARALADATLADLTAAAPALESLVSMAELLPTAAPAQLEALAGILKTADAAARPPLLLVLALAPHDAACKALLEGWRQDLPRHEALPAAILLARKPDTPAGALAAVLLMDSRTFHARAWRMSQIDPRSLALLRVLHSSPAADALALLGKLAQDEISDLRALASATLAMCGQDGPYVADWVRRVAGEVPDRQAAVLHTAVALSTSRAAQDFRARVMQQGAASPHIGVVVASVRQGRAGDITAEKLAQALFDAPAGARRWVDFALNYEGALPAGVLNNLATGLLFAEDARVMADPRTMLFLAVTGVDVQPLLFGQSDAGAPRDGARLTLAALMGRPEGAAQLLGKAQLAEDASNWGALQYARAWLGLLEPAENERLLRAAGAGEPWQAFLLYRDAAGGETGALRALLDRHGAQGARFAPGATAGVALNADRYSRQAIELQGVAGEVLAAQYRAPSIPRNLLERFFDKPPVQDWDAWWQCRRALAVPVAGGKYRFEELP